MDPEVQASGTEPAVEPVLFELALQAPQGWGEPVTGSTVYPGPACCEDAAHGICMAGAHMARVLSA